jgi:hypothetical protein
MFSSLIHSKKIFISILGIAFLPWCLVAQEKKDSTIVSKPVLENNTSANTTVAPASSSLPLKVSFDKGVKFSSPDESFGLQIRFRMQNRAGISYLDQNSSGYDLTNLEAKIRRARLRLDGHMLSKKLEYHIQLSFSRDDMDWDNSSVPNVLRDAFVVYKFTPNFELTFGQTKLPGNRQRVNSSGDLQFVDRSIVNATYNIDRDFLLMAKKSGKIGIDYILKTSISGGEGRNSRVGNAGACYSARLELLPLGKFTDGGDYFESDLAREEKPKISIAAGSSFNDRAVRERGQLGSALNSATTMQVHHIDFLLKYRGFSLSSEWMQRNSTNPFPDGTLATDKNPKIPVVPVGSGLNIQAGYLFKSNYEIAGRYTHVTPRASVQSKLNYVQEYTLGLSKYYKKHNVKLQSDITYRQETNLISDVVKNKGFEFRIQLQVGI